MRRLRDERQLLVYSFCSYRSMKPVTDPIGQLGLLFVRPPMVYFGPTQKVDLRLRNGSAIMHGLCAGLDDVQWSMVSETMLPADGVLSSTDSPPPPRSNCPQSRGKRTSSGRAGPVSSARSYWQTRTRAHALNLPRWRAFNRRRFRASLHVLPYPLVQLHHALVRRDCEADVAERIRRSQRQYADLLRGNVQLLLAFAQLKPVEVRARQVASAERHGRRTRADPPSSPLGSCASG